MTVSERSNQRWLRCAEIYLRDIQLFPIYRAQRNTTNSNLQSADHFLSNVITARKMTPLKIVKIIGSINKDLVYVVPHMPAGGETLTATRLEITSGGKGANQAVAAGRLSRHESGTVKDYTPDVNVYMTGAVGIDGKEMIADLALQGLLTDGIKIDAAQPTGTAMILLEEKTGENRIVLAPGANHTLLPTHFLRAQDLGTPLPSLIVLQLEIPLPTVMQILRTAAAAGVDVLLNPAPAIALPEEAYAGITHLILNETEAAILTNRSLGEVEAEKFDWSTVTSEFLAKGVRNVVVTLGAKGAYYASTSSSGHIQGEKVTKVVDTTAAGDTFVGAAALKLVRKGEGGVLEKEDVLICCRAAGVTVQRFGAIPSIPWGGEVEGML
ncbi:ribokinase-like protein [Calycina marina]|uniref:Ribokinase n=1 Tax=Calycina marina TaxID=1763456 RepID=A0A9P7Z3B2_9HELO|nr:ribokinase-like protein [Calycina marina]